MPPSTTALSLPEILSNILSRADTGTLAATIRVNRFWFECSINFLWDVPAGIALPTMDTESPRRALYAARITSLSMSGDVRRDIHYFRLRGLTFPRLREVQLRDIFRGTPLLAPYFGPTLQVLRLSSVKINISFLGSLCTECPRLRVLVVSALRGKDLTPASFCRFIAGNTSIESIKLRPDSQNLITDELLLHFARRPRLTTLNLGGVLEHRTWQRIIAEVATPFSALTSANLCLSSAAGRLLPRAAPHLKELKLVISDSHEPVIPHLGPLADSLERLVFGYTLWRVDLPACELIAFNVFKNLTELRIRPFEVGGLVMNSYSDGAGIRDDTLDILVRELKHLRIFQFDVESEVSDCALEIMARNCPLLEELILCINAQLEKACKSLKFLCLRYLCLKTLTGNTTGKDSLHDVVARIAPVLRESMPKLKLLQKTPFTASFPPRNPASRQNHPASDHSPCIALNQRRASKKGRQSMIPSEQVLGLTEILTNILNCLPWGDLAKSVRVNRLWFECGIATLWRSPPSRSLATAVRAGSPRASLYAAQIDFLFFAGNEDGALHKSLTDLAFPRLRHLTLDAYRPDDGVYPVAQYFGGALRNIDFYGGSLDEATLDALRERSGGALQQLMIDGLDGVSPAAFYRLISGCRALQRLVFMYKMEGFLTDDLMVHLAGCEHLEQLAARSIYHNAALWERVVEEVEKPFPRLRVIDTVLPPAAVKAFVSAITQVSSLSLVLSAGGPEPVVRSLTTLTALRKLSLQYPDQTDISRGELMALAHLKQLQELTIIPMYALDSSLSSYEDGLTDDDFIALFAELRDLQVLQFEVQCRISPKAFYSLAESCPSLLTCTLLSEFYLRNMDYEMKPGVVFRSLVGLSLTGLVGNRLQGMVIDIEGDAKDQVELFRRFMPNLEELSLHSENIFSQEVYNVFDNRNGESDLQETGDRE